MPFNYEEYQQKCDTLTTDQLQKEWESYTRQIAGGSTSTATSVLCSPLTGGVSLIGLGLSAPRIHNARKKREIIEAKLQARGATHVTRTRDVAGSVALSGAIGGLSFGLLGPGADVVAQVAADGAGLGVEHKVGGHIKKTGLQELEMKTMQQQIQMQQQYQGFQQQYVQGEQGMAGMQSWQMMQPALQFQPQLGAIQGTQQPQLSGYQPGLQVSGLQPGPQLPQQPHSAALDRKYEYAFMPPTNNNLQQFQPASHQEQFTQPVVQPQNTFQQSPNYQSIQQPENNHVPIPNPPVAAQQPPFPEKSPAYTTQEVHYSEAPNPLSTFPQQAQAQAPPNNTQPRSAELENAGPPNNDAAPAAPNMEDEIAFLKARIMQMELEERGKTSTITNPSEINADGFNPEPRKLTDKPRHQDVVHEGTDVSGNDIKPNPKSQSSPESHVEADVTSEELPQQHQRLESLSDPQIPIGHPTLPYSPQQQQSTSSVPIQSSPVHVQYINPSAPPNTQAQQFAPLFQAQSPTGQQQHPQSSATPNSQSQQYTPPPEAVQQIQQLQGQNSLVASSIPVSNLVSPAPPQQQYIPPPPPPSGHAQNTYQPPLLPHQQEGYQVPQPQQQIYLPQPQVQEAQYQPTSLQHQTYQPNPISAPTQPRYHSQDSGYYTAAPTPLQRPSSISAAPGPISQQSFNPSQYPGSVSYVDQKPYSPQQQYGLQQGYNPQMHGRSTSVVSSVSLPPPPPYFAPPGHSQSSLDGKDYFSQGAAPQPGGYQPWYNNQPQR